jgi:hypothetical protein
VPVRESVHADGDRGMRLGSPAGNQKQKQLAPT